MSITKHRGFCKKLSQKLSFSFPQKEFRSYRFVKLGDTEATLESKLVESVRPRHSSVTPRLLGFHRELNSVTLICNFWLDRKVQVQWPRPNRTDRIFQIGKSEMISAET